MPEDRLVQGKAQISVDEFGRVLLRGVVASEEVKRAIEQEAASVPGVSAVINELSVEKGTANPDEPPPLPQPVGRDLNEPPAGPAVPPPPQPQPPADAKLGDRSKKPLRLDSSPLTARVVDAFAHQPNLAKALVKISTTEGTVTLSGKVASSYEAMLAFRAAEQTPGVREVVDQLEFPIPDEDAANPLVQKARPEDLVPYLGYHIRRNVGDVAHIDRIEVHGDMLGVHGTVAHADDRRRVAAILRSIPILRGFRIEPTLHVN